MYECTLRRSTNLWFIDKVNPEADPYPPVEDEAKSGVTQKGNSAIIDNNLKMFEACGLTHFTLLWV